MRWRSRYGNHLLCHRLIVFLLLCKELASVVVREVKLVTKARKDNDYVLHGEEATLVCLFEMHRPEESLLRVEWYLNGNQVYIWERNRPPKAMGALQGRVDLTNKSPSQIKIEKADMAMHGMYDCKMTTDLGDDKSSLDVTVIVDACKESDWETHTDMIRCTDTVSLHCVGMFPKPSPQCGVIDKKTQHYITSVPLDKTDQLRNGTYDIRMNRRFYIKDWINHTDITFSCDIIVKETTWKRSTQHNLFGERGCPINPPELEGGYFNLTEGITCWGNPRDGVLARYSCLDPDLRAIPESLVCRNGSWQAGSTRNGSWILDEEQGPLRCDAGSLCSDSFPLIFPLLLCGLIFHYISSRKL